MQCYIIAIGDARSTRKRSGVQARFQIGNLVAALFRMHPPLQRKERGTQYPVFRSLLGSGNMALVFLTFVGAHVAAASVLLVGPGLTALIGL